MATTKPPATEASLKQGSNMPNSGLYHWGSRIPSSPKMRQLLTEHEQLLTEHEAQQTHGDSQQATTKKTLV